MGFLTSPFEDLVFARIAALNGYENDGREWPATIKGTLSEDIKDLPKGMPEFQFTPGTCPYDGHLIITFSNIKLPDVLYIHTSQSRPHLSMRRDRLPETIWTSLPGRPVGDLIAHPAFEGLFVADETARDLGTGFIYSDIILC